MKDVMEIIAYIASLGVWIRFWPYMRQSYATIRRRSVNLKHYPTVSIIIPARNEAHAITHILDSLLQLDITPYEIIVVDDRSEDHTAQLAEQYPVRLITAPPKPSGWSGKNWACQTGALHARGEVILFTDADTKHTPYSLRHALTFMHERNAAMISAPAYHINKKWWQRLLGPFFCVLHTGASPYDKPSSDNAFALGQYLMINKKFYDSLDRHEHVHDQISEDTALARMTLARGANYEMYRGRRLCEVQMFNTASEFITGWLRLLRLGMQHLNPVLIALTLMPLLALNFWNLTSGNWSSWIPVLSTLTCFALVQNTMGRFNAIGLLLFPIPVFVFVILALWACLCQALKLPMTWRGRVYMPVAKT